MEIKQEIARFPREWLNTEQAAQLIGCTRRNVTKVIHSGELPAVRVGRDWLIHRNDAEAYRVSPPNPGPKPSKS